MSRAFRLGLFIVATLLILALGVFLVGRQESRFVSTYQAKAAFQNVVGLNEGAGVRVGGIHKGVVQRIDLPNRPDGKVTVVMDLESATRKIVKKDSVASIKSEGLLGDKYVEVSFGSPEADPLKNGETIESEPPLDISNLIKKADQILDTSQSAIENIEGAAGDLKAISSKISRGQGTVGALINDKTMYKEASAGATAFQENMEALKHNFFLRGFYKKRGYEDSDDLTKNAIAELPSGPVMKTFVYDANQLFEKPDTAKLTHQKVLNETGRFLEANKFGMAVVMAAAGVKGDSDKERVLTQARTMVVRDYLVDNFRIDDTRIKTTGLGKTKDTSDDNKVKIIVYPAGSNAPAPVSQSQAGRNGN
jgi:phospholipid/cholesterol/gamma-HCH transport system substrate-binding protein